MYLKSLWDSCRRRWWLVLTCLAVSVGILFGASLVVQPNYQQTANVVLVPPKNPDSPNQNRYLGLGGLKQSADVLANAAMSDDVALELLERFPQAEYTVEGDVTTSAPTLIITIESPSARTTTEMTDAVMQVLPQTLVHLQQQIGIGKRNQITLVTVARDHEPEPVAKARIRALGMVAAFLLAISAMVVAVVDGVLLRRRTRFQSPPSDYASVPEDEMEPERRGQVLDLGAQGQRIAEAQRIHRRQ